MRKWKGSFDVSRAHKISAGSGPDNNSKISFFWRITINLKNLREEISAELGNENAENHEGVIVVREFNFENDEPPAYEEQ